MENLINLKNFLSNTDLREWRCVRCGRLLAKELVAIGTIEIKCRNCKQLNTISFDDLEILLSFFTENKKELDQ